MLSRKRKHAFQRGVVQKLEFVGDRSMIAARSSGIFGQSMAKMFSSYTKKDCMTNHLEKNGLDHLIDPELGSSIIFAQLCRSEARKSFDILKGMGILDTVWLKRIEITVWKLIYI